LAIPQALVPGVHRSGRSGGSAAAPVAPEIGEHGGYLCCELIDAPGELLIEFGESFIYSREDSGRGGF